MKTRFLAVLAASLLWAGLAMARVDINSASRDELDGLKGIGPTKAQAIVDYRRKNGSFNSVDDLQNVPGIGPSIVNKLRGEVSVGGQMGRTSSTAPRALPAPAVRPVDPPKQRDSAAVRPAQPARPAAPPMTRPSVPSGEATARPAASPAAPARPATPGKPAAPAAAQPVQASAPASAPSGPARPVGIPAPARPAAVN